jgi:ribosomal-protein-alanine N-acetyltransferase
MDETDFNIRSVTISDRSRLANLIHFGSHIHQHLDWKPPLEWIGREPYFLIEKKEGLIAALACPPELPEITWVRLFAVSSTINTNRAWSILWDATQVELAHSGKAHVAALSLQSWFNEILEESNFQHTDNVVVLMWNSTNTLPESQGDDIIIRPMLLEDLAEVVEIDNTAFDLEWRNSSESLELAYQQSSLATLAVTGDEIIGYQFSTSSAMGGHLARLAVKTSMQSRGIGYHLVNDVIKQFRKRGINHITVNTQQNNHASLALYAKAGFNTTGESYRVYQYIIS